MDTGTNAGTSAGAGMGGILMGLLIGAFVGGVVALLFAPQTGSQTREMIRNRAGQIGDAFRGISQDIRRTAEKPGEQMRHSAEEIS